MTAIDGLERLESPALWRADADGQRQNVFVAIGEAELVILDSAGTALTHWSLPALIRLNPRKEPALYAPGEGSDEELEISETEMIGALDRVTAAVEKGRRRPGRLRRIMTGLTIGLAAGFAIMWTPGAVRDVAANILPLPARAEMGDRMLDAITQLTGPACKTPTGTEALQTLKTRLLPLRPARFAVVQDLPHPVLALPGGLFVISDEILVTQDDPELVAGHVLAAALTSGANVPLRTLLADLGPLDLIRLMASGEVSQPALTAHAKSRLLADPPEPDAARLRPGFATARLGWDAYANSVGLHVPPDAPPMPPAMDDTTWQALRGICDG
ncbi:MAG: hypothetical protein AAGF30_13835 [Pseudomonadota bacterium]